jgi:HTH-type transcriptional regulator, transcriptional repressor of NAD biosynthesis genes
VHEFRHGLVVGKFFPPHAGHHHLIDTAEARCGRLTVVVAPARSEWLPLELRLAWLREVHPGVEFAGVYDDVPIDYEDSAIWDAHCEIFRSALDGAVVDAVFSSEAYGDELARRFDAVHVSVDPDRTRHPVSGTAVRTDPAGHWEFLAAPVRAYFTRRVAVVGAESTGTTTMARALASALRDRGGCFRRTTWIGEFGRDLTQRKLDALRDKRPTAQVTDVTWSRADFVEVATAQNAREDAAAREGSPILVCDTDARATAVWEERYLGSASAAVLALAREPDLYLLTDHVGVPFEDDGLRDGEHLRTWMTGRFREVLAGRPVVELTGPHSDRLATALAACDALLTGGVLAGR